MNPNHHCLHCDKIHKDWEERRFCCGNCEDEFLFHTTQEKREQKISEFIKKSKAFAELEEEMEEPCLECGKPMWNHEDDNECFSYSPK